MARNPRPTKIEPGVPRDGGGYEFFTMQGGMKTDGMHNEILDDPAVDLEIVCAPSVRQWLEAGYPESEARQMCGLPAIKPTTGR